MSSTNPKSPWSSGPAEVLRHGVELLANDSDVNRRLAMISIDNAVELMLRTYLGLPKRITGLQIGRKEYEEAKFSFPALLDATEKYAPEKLDGVDPGVFEWYHRLRNQLYHTQMNNAQISELQNIGDRLMSKLGDESIATE